MVHYFLIYFEVFFGLNGLQIRLLRATILVECLFSLSEPVLPGSYPLFLVDLNQCKVGFQKYIRIRLSPKRSNRQLLRDCIYTSLQEPYILEFLRYHRHFQVSISWLLLSQLFEYSLFCQKRDFQVLGLDGLSLYCEETPDQGLWKLQKTLF